MADIVEMKREGNRLFAAKAYREAEEAFRRLIRAAPDRPEGYVGAARVLDVQDRLDDIVNLLEPIADELNSSQIWRALANAYRMRVFRGEAALSKRAIAAHRRYLMLRSDPVAWFYLGELLFKQHDYSGALEAYKHAWESELSDEEAYRGVIASAKKLGRLDEIRKAEERWSSRNS